ncbi:hypothetical protein BD410DRAFT_837414 [Rickenella mellea]|uniref:Uncharacterized protein n=1 Tax=Rickenella mellea TaxID=50990 RepID=A0A4Y7QD38_9AGAM|nr:hypothetical protein BD410DRAFT_837414 [Rickenella mellea]
MNNPKSVMLGWSALLVAAGAGYIMARKDINARRQVQEADGVRPSEKLDWKARVEREVVQGSSSQKNTQDRNPHIPPLQSDNPPVK